MTTMSADAIRTIHAHRTAKGAGYAPSIAETLAAARAGLLVDVDTQNDGEDALVIAESADDALAEVAMSYAIETSTSHPDGAAAWARERGWTADCITLARDSA